MGAATATPIKGKLNYFGVLSIFLSVRRMRVFVIVRYIERGQELLPDLVATWLEDVAGDSDEF
jgi:hypothetical protein